MHGNLSVKISERARHKIKASRNSEATDLRQYVLVTEPGAEFKAARHLTAEGFDPWVPHETVKKTRRFKTYWGESRKTIEVTKPIFHGYLFIPLNRAWSFGPFYSTPGLRKRPFLLIDGEPAVLNEFDVLKIQGAEQELRTAPIRGLRLNIGEQVRISDGPLTGFTATIEKLDDESRIGLLMDILGAKRRFLATADQFEAV